MQKLAPKSNVFNTSFSIDKLPQILAPKLFKPTKKFGSIPYSSTHKTFRPLNIASYLSKWKINDECFWIRQHKLSICKIGRKQSKNWIKKAISEWWIFDQRLIHFTAIDDSNMLKWFYHCFKHIFLRLNGKKVAKYFFYLSKTEKFL